MLLGHLVHLCRGTKFRLLIRNAVDAMFAHVRLMPSDLNDTGGSKSRPVGNRSKLVSDRSVVPAQLQTTASFAASWVERVKSETDLPLFRELQVDEIAKHSTFTLKWLRPRCSPRSGTSWLLVMNYPRICSKCGQVPFSHMRNEGYPRYVICAQTWQGVINHIVLISK